MTDTNLTVYQIPAINLPGLLHRMNALSNKSIKILGKPITLSVLGEVRSPRMTARGAQWVEVKDIDGNPCFDISYNVTIDAEPPRIKGWSFLATIDHSSSTGNIIRVAPGTDFKVPVKYRTIEPKCDHCRLDRQRKDTFLLRQDGSKKVMQIGRSCLADFLGNDVESVVAMAESVVNNTRPLDEDGEGDWSGGMGSHRYIYVRTYLAHVAAVSRKNGWVSKKMADEKGWQSTSSFAYLNMFPPPGGKFRPVPIIEQDLEAADAAITWGRTQSRSRQEYLYALSVIAADTMIEHRSIGLAASMVNSMMQARAKQAERALNGADESRSVHVGNVDERITDLEATFYGHWPMPIQWGAKFRSVFLTADGNVLVWFASSGAADKNGLTTALAVAKTPVKITGRIKKHNDYNGVKQTILTHCNVTILGAS